MNLRCLSTVQPPVRARGVAGSKYGVAGAETGAEAGAGFVVEDSVTKEVRVGQGFYLRAARPPHSSPARGEG